jgi:hypothetical protein
MNEHQLVELVKKAYKDKVVNPHHFRVLYATEKVLKMRSAEKIIDSLDVSDHSLKTFLTIYERSGKPAIKALKGTFVIKETNIPTQNPIHIQHFSIYVNNSLFKEFILPLKPSNILL